jgi:aspartokinase
MITIAEAVGELVRSSPLLEEGISKNIINYSSLARLIKPEVEEKVFKTIKTGAIIMALKRLSKRKYAKEKDVRAIFKQNPDMIVRSNLMEYTLVNSDTLIDKHRHFFSNIQKNHKHFFIITQGVFETAIILSRDLRLLVEQNFKKEKIISVAEDLSAITIQLPEINVTTPGLYGYILKSLGWEGINVIEVASTYTEFTIILKETDVDRAFSVLKKTLTPK